MATPRQDGRPGLLGEPPDHVRVTVTMLPGRGSSLRGHLAGVVVRARRRILIAVGVGLLALVAAISLNGAGGTPRGVRGEGPAAHPIAARCPSAVSLDQADSLRDGFGQAVWCMRYAAHTASISYRFIGGPLPAFGPASRK